MQNCHPRIKKRRNLIRMRRIRLELRERLLELASPDPDAEGSGVDHEDQPAVPVGGSSQDLETFEDEGGSLWDENEYHWNRQNDDN